MGTLSRACLALTGERPVARRPLHGGDLSEVVLLTLASGRSVVAKRGKMVDREARMVAALAKAGAPVPALLGHAADVMLLDYLPEGPTDGATWSRLGEDLARLHATPGPAYGWPEDYAFGPVPIANAPLDGWPDFWAERRLLPALSALPAALARRVETLAGRLDALLPPAPAPTLLHGDLWSGNLLVSQGRAHLIDPACYYGPGEVDLAMLNLFGRPGPGFAEAYGALEPGWQGRRAIYSLYPALTHVCLFGAGYHGMVERFLTAAGA